MIHTKSAYNEDSFLRNIVIKTVKSTIFLVMMRILWEYMRFLNKRAPDNRKIVCYENKRKEVEYMGKNGYQTCLKFSREEMIFIKLKEKVSLIDLDYGIKTFFEKNRRNLKMTIPSCSNLTNINKNTHGIGVYRKINGINDFYKPSSLEIEVTTIRIYHALRFIIEASRFKVAYFIGFNNPYLTNSYINANKGIFYNGIQYVDVSILRIHDNRPSNIFYFLYPSFIESKITNITKNHGIFLKKLKYTLETIFIPISLLVLMIKNIPKHDLDKKNLLKIYFFAPVVLCKENGLFTKIITIILSIYLIASGLSLALIGGTNIYASLYSLFASLTIWSYLITNDPKTDTVLKFLLLLCTLFFISLLTRLVSPKSRILAACLMLMLYEEGLPFHLITHFFDINEFVWLFLFIIVTCAIVYFFPYIYVAFYIFLYALYGLGSFLVGLDMITNHKFGFAMYGKENVKQTLHFESNFAYAVYIFCFVICFILQFFIFRAKHKKSENSEQEQNDETV